jgi:murein L,D-transpeptidase YcbB/YkuD
MQNSVSRFTVEAAVALVLLILSVMPASAANNEAVGAALKQLISAPSVKTGSSFADAHFSDIKAFYASRNFKPVWSRDSGPKGKAKALLGELRASSVHGLSPDFYGVDEISGLMKSEVPSDLARMDFLFTGALVEFAHDLLNGRITNQGSYTFNQIAPVRLDPAKLVERAAAAGNLRVMLAEIIGDDRRYLRLVSKMLEYGRLDRPGIWPEKVSETDLASVRRMLALTGDLPFDMMNSKAPMDETLVRAVRSYQIRHGIEISGEIDSAILGELGLPLAERTRRIKANLERRRWQNRPAEGRMLYLNLVDGQLKLLENDKTQGLIAIGTDESLGKLPTFYGTITGISRFGSGKDSRLELLYTNAGEALDAVVTGTFSISDADGKATEFMMLAIGAVDQAALKSLGEGDPMMVFSEPPRLFVTYLTVWATRNGKIQFRPDVYGRDAALMQKLGL